jgi:phosphoglycolate phosphatase
MSRAVLFDLDGTLIDSRRDLALSTNAALRAVGLPERPEVEIGGFVGEGSRRLIEQAIAPRLDLFQLAHAVWEEHYASHLIEHTAPYPGILGLLERLDRATLAVHTNKPGPFARQIVEGLGLSERFALVLGGGDGPARKPDPAGVLWILERLGARAEQAIYVGDSRIDAATARSAGVRFIGAAWGFGGERELREAGASEIASDADELAALLNLRLLPTPPSPVRL